MMNYVLKDAVPRSSLQVEVSGHHRHKYFSRPLVSVLPQKPEQMVVQIPEEAVISGTRGVEEVLAEPKAKTVEIQTDYRESETQTDPFTPEYQVVQGETPEVLTIAHFQFGRGLPASMTEMEIVELMREKRGFENALPPTSDEASFILRRNLMEQQEIREWNRREEDIKKLQNERLNLLQSALVEREKETEEKHAERVDEIRLKKTENKERSIAKIQRKRIKVLRKMFKARKAVENKNEGRDIIEEYGNFGSTVYAPITRDGLSLDKKANKYEVQPDSLSTYAGLQELGAYIPRKHFTTKIDVSKPQIKFKKGLTRKEDLHLKALKKMQDVIDRVEKPDKKKEEDKAEYEKREFHNIVIRPATPEYEEHLGRRPDPKQAAEDDRREAAIILLQRLVRGRADQNMMFEGKEKRLDLIAELRATEEWRKEADTEEEKQLLQNYQERVMDGVSEAMQGTIISQTFDRLSKELLRFKQERRIAAMVRLAENDRRKREAEESGRRQAEEILRSREDLLYEQTMNVHHGTIDSYLQGILSKSISDASAKQAFEEAKIRARHLNNFVDRMESKMNKPEVIVRDLMQSFLLPDVQRRKLQRQIQLEEKRFLEAARRSIQTAMGTTGAALQNARVLNYGAKK